MTSAAQSFPDGADAASIVPYVPRLTVEWLRDEPEARWRVVDGTLAFVDISGFTAMAERLAGRGRLGAEEVSGVMNAVFAALLEDAYAFGGGLLKFGGDALLLLYDGEGHAARAARAAHRMRRTLRAIGRPRTSAGTVALRMHVGIHSAPLHFFLVGSSHRELLVAGPGATRTVEMEAASEAGEILLSPETAALVGPRALGEAKGPGFLLKAAPEASELPQLLGPLADLALEEAVPSSVRAEVTSSRLEGEHRNAAVGFVRFAGTDELLASDGPAALADALDTLVRVVQTAADDHGVTFLESDIDRNGGRIILVAGAPQTTGEDEERLLRTLRLIVDAGQPLTLNVGASRGRVFAGHVGATFRRTYTILGDTAALAARLMARAQANQILVAEAVVARIDGRFETEELEPLRVKGKSQPVRAVALGPLLEAPKARDVAPLPFVDRERERAVLGASVAPVRMGFGTLVELVGEPGIGKSRLSDELRSLCADMAALTISCDQYATLTPYHPFRNVLRSLLGVQLDGDAAANREALAAQLGALDPELAQWAPLLAAPLDVPVESTPEVDELESGFRRARLHGVVASALVRLLDSPTLLLLEDVHWMDEPSSELLRHIATQLPTRPWLFCSTRRPVGGGFEAAVGTPPLPALTLRLEPLPADDARELIRAAAGGRTLRDDELQAIAERGAGNPLFLQELAATGREAEDAEELPENVQALVAARIDKLAPLDRALLRWASVLGTSFSAAMVAAVLEDDSSAPDSDAWDRLAEFVERDPDVAGGFRFRHVLIRDAAYEGLSYQRRRELHRRVAEVGEARFAGRTDDVVELLSLHYHRAGVHLKAWEYSRVAGNRARGKWANVEAAEFYRRALDEARFIPGLDPSEIAPVWEALGDCLQLAGDLDEAAVAFASARRLFAKDAHEQLPLLRKEGALRELTGKYSEALRWYTRGLKAARALPDAEARDEHGRRFRLAQAQVRFRQGELGECIRHCREVAEEAAAAGDLATLAPTYMMLHLVYASTGSPERVGLRGLALPLYEELDDLRGQATALNNLGIEAYYEGDWEKALDLYGRARDLYERIGDVTNAAMSTNNIGEIRSDQGHFDTAVELFEQVQRTCEVAGQRPLAAVALGNVGRAAARAGDLDAAQEALLTALETFSDLRVGSFVLETETRLAEVELLRADRPDRALWRLDGILDRARTAELEPLRAAALRLRAAARFQLEDADGAHADLAESVRIARDVAALYELALALDVLGRAPASASADTDADAAAAEAAAAFERLHVERVVRVPLAARAV